MKINLYALLVTAFFLTGCMSSGLDAANEISILPNDSMNVIQEAVPAGETAVSADSDISFRNDFSSYYWEPGNTAAPGVHTLVLLNLDHSFVLEIDFYSVEGGSFPLEQTYTALNLDEVNDIYNDIAFEKDWSLIEGRAGLTLYDDHDNALYTYDGIISYNSGEIELNNLSLKYYDNNGYIEGTGYVFSTFIDLNRMEEIQELFIS